MTAIDLFSGAGGLSLGLKQAGWSLIGAVEWDRQAAETHRLNFPEVPILGGDVRGINWTAHEGVDLIAGGPPCQPFSVSGKQLGDDDDRDMVPEFVRAVRETRPRAFLMENVAGLASARFSHYLCHAISALEALGYNVKHRVLDAADYGVPQRRERLIVVGVREGRFDFPEPTHGPGRDRDWVTVRNALFDCPLDDPNNAKVVYSKNPILRRSPHAGMMLNGKGRPLNLDAPSLTIPATAGGNRTHVLDPDGVLIEYHRHLYAGGSPKVGQPEGCRRLTILESARLQDFPDWFTFTGKRSKQYAQIGNAVPPGLARAVGAAIKRTLEGEVRSLREQFEMESLFG